jgi:TonB family protein
MKRIIITGLMLSALTAFGQELRKVTIDVTGRLFSFRDEYHVLKDAPKVWQGSYKRTKNKLVIEEGYYKNNKKDSTWITYGSYGDILVKGNYANGEKVGTWRYFTNEGQLEQAYDFTKQELVSFMQEKKARIYQIINDKDTIFAPLSRPPLLIGGHYTYLEKLAQSLCYPSIKNNTGGTVFISFIIDEMGKTSNYKIIKKGDKVLDKEALRLAKQLGKWLPAIKDDKPVKIIHIVPIVFDNANVVHPF